MDRLKVCVVEDEMLVSAAIVRYLQILNYKITEVADSYESAIQIIEKEKPDLCLLDISLRGKNEGLAIGSYLYEKTNIPFIFLTGQCDSEIIRKAKLVKPLAFLLKPISQNDLFSTIEIAMVDRSDKNREFIMVKDGQKLVKIFLDEILFIEHKREYSIINRKDKTINLVRATTKDIFNRLPNIHFFQVNRTFIVNKNYITEVTNSEIILEKISIPISKSVREKLREYLDSH